MNKVTNLSFLFLVSTLSSLAHGSMLGRLQKTVATRLARSTALHRTTARNMEIAALKAKYDSYRKIISLENIAARAMTGFAGASVCGGISYQIVCAVYPDRPCRKHQDRPLEYNSKELREKMGWNEFTFSRKDGCEAQSVGRAFGIVGAAAGSCLGGPVGAAVFASAAAAASYVKAMQKK